MRLYVRRRRRIRILLRPFVRLALLKIVFHRYLVRRRDRAQRELERRERITLQSELELLRAQVQAQNVAREKELESVNQAQQETLQRVQDECARLQKKHLQLEVERDEEARRAADLERLRAEAESERDEAKKLALTRKEPTRGPTMTAELARLRAENEKLKERVAIIPEDSDLLQVKRLQDENELLRAKNAQQMREQMVEGVQCIMDENDRLKRRPDALEKELERLRRENMELKEGAFRQREQETHFKSSPSAPRKNHKPRVKLLSEGGDISAASDSIREQNRELLEKMRKPGSVGRSQLRGQSPAHRHSSKTRTVDVLPATTESPQSIGITSTSPNSVATPSRGRSKDSGKRETSPPWRPERPGVVKRQTFLAAVNGTPTQLVAQRTSPGLETLEDAFSTNSPIYCRRECIGTNGNQTPTGNSPEELDQRMMLSPLSWDSPSKCRDTEISYIRFNLEDEIRSRLKQPVIRRNG